MGRFFDLDSPIMRFLNRLGDLMILNVLVLICCLPVVTAGAAFTAMHYVLLKIVRGQEGYLVRGFFKSFKQNFRQATTIWLIILLAAAIIIADLIILNAPGVETPRIFTVLILAISLILTIAAVYVFPVLARFDNTIKNTLKNAFFIAFLNLPKSILMVLLIALPFVILYFSDYSGVFMIMFGISAPAYASVYLYSGIFKRFEPEEQKPASDYDFSITTSSENEK